MTEVTFVEDLIQKIVDKKREKDKAAEVVSGINKEIDALETKAIEVLTELDLDDYRGKLGTITRKQKWSVKVPQTPADKKVLISYLQAEGLADTYLTVNSRSLQTLYLDLWQVAKEEGKGMEFSLPGVEQPLAYEKLGFRKR